MSYTKGPWRIELESIEHDGEYAEPSIWSAPDDSGLKKHIAVIRVGLPGSQDNGGLICAAPELLEALKNLVRCNEEWNAAVMSIIGRPLDWNASYLNAAKAAIAKAEGGTP